VLAAAPVYFGVTRPDQLLNRSVAMQPRPAPALEQRTAASVARDNSEPGSITVAPRFSAASRPPLTQQIADQAAAAAGR